MHLKKIDFHITRDHIAHHNRGGLSAQFVGTDKEVQNLRYNNLGYKKNIYDFIFFIYKKLKFFKIK